MKCKTVKQVLSSLAKVAGMNPTYLKELIESGAKSLPIVMSMASFVKLYNTGRDTDTRLLKPHTRQRETQNRLQKVAGAGGHLHKTILAHTEIVIAFFQGQLYLVDGNHRAMLWCDYADAERPTHVTLIVKMYDDDEDEAFTNLYYAYDSKAALESNRQKMYGYMSAAGFAHRLKTTFFRGGKFVSAMKLLPGYIKGKEPELIAQWAVEIEAFDADLHLSGEKAYNAGVVAAILVLYREHRRNRQMLALFLEMMANVSSVRNHVRTSNGRREMSNTEIVVDNLDRRLKKVWGPNNEAIIRTKKEITFESFASFAPAYRAESKRKSPVKRTSLNVVN